LKVEAIYRTIDAHIAAAMAGMAIAIERDKN
jgi:hypothetical protein